LGFDSRKAGVVDGFSLTVFSAPASMVTGTSNAAGPNFPRSVPDTGARSWLLRVASMETSAREVSGRGRVVVTSGFSMDTGPLVVRYTSAQMPVFRPRMVGMQSQQMEADRKS